MTISMDVFSEMYEDVAKKLLDENQWGRGVVSRRRKKV